MRLLRIFVVILVIFGLNGVDRVKSQDVMTLEEAVATGLENNHGILVARNEAEIGDINRSLGNAGFLPSVYLSGTWMETDDIIHASVDGVREGREEINTHFLSADIALDWTLFDGLRMFTSYNRLTELRNLGEKEARILIEETVIGIIEVFYEIVRQEKLLRVLESSIEMSQERVRIAERKRELGSGSEYEILLARADLNTDRAAYIQQEVIVNDARLQLRQLLDLDLEDSIEVEESIELADELTYNELFAGFTENNPELEAASIRSSVSRLELNEIRTERLPELELNIGYGAFREEAQNSLLLLEEQAGLRFGITARFNLFDGFNTNRRAQIAHINRRNSEILADETYKQLEMVLRSEYKNYISTHRLVELENENLGLAERALEIAFERFRLATITSVELRETQRILLDTENRLITALYETKISEAELLRISGRLGSSLQL